MPKKRNPIPTDGLRCTRWWVERNHRSSCPMFGQKIASSARRERFLVAQRVSSSLPRGSARAFLRQMHPASPSLDIVSRLRRAAPRLLHPCSSGLARLVTRLPHGVPVSVDASWLSFWPLTLRILLLPRGASSTNFSWVLPFCAS